MSQPPEILYPNGQVLAAQMFIDPGTGPEEWDGSVSIGPVTITGVATSVNQTNGSQKTQVVDGSGNVISSTGNALDVNVKTPATLPISGTVTANLGTIGSAATAAKQDTGNTSLNSIDGKVPSLGQALAASSVPVVLPATQIISLTAPVLAAGSAIIGKVGIDQTTPGTTNGVQVNAALPAGSNLVGYVGQKNTYGNKTTLTTTNWSNLASGSGWQSDSITTNGAREILFNLKSKGAAGSTGLGDFYLAEQLTSGNWTDGATGTEGTFTAANRKNSIYLGGLQFSTTSSVVGPLRVAAIVGILPPVLALIGINNSGGTISSTGSDTLFEYQLVN